MKPLFINNQEFAKKQEVIAHEIDVESCERLLDLVETNTQLPKKISYMLTGTPSRFHFPSLVLHIEATLPVLCQRCLQVMSFNLSEDYTYIITKEEPEAFDGDEEVDWLEVSRVMNVNELVEDELIMAMPLGPLHEYTCKKLMKEDVEKRNPFAALKDLIK